MTSKGLPPRVAAGMYFLAGVLFVAGALAAQRPGFAAVGVAFALLGAAMWLRQRKGRD
ncbi:MFS transporter [Pseudoxanthomonas koreensis]|uniref:MFS transporter n=1 Tax=Pseudoxanthomonas koreensis TaxID=266061 RepID=UPI001391CE16|nr:MFS transporter [Pseudoxanthomonas koreensis]KAF1697787.1 MFS transporter [Pseudoxanthomonas koreensis]